MTTIEEFLNGSETGGFVKGTAIKVGKPRQQGQYKITDVTLDDGTGQIGISFFELDDQPNVGDSVYVSQVYVKEFKGNNQLNVKKGAEITFKPKSGGSTTSAKKDDKKAPSKGSGSTGSGGKSSDDGWAKAAAQVTIALDDVKLGIIEAITEMKVALLDQLKANAGIKKESKIESGQEAQEGDSEPEAESGPEDEG